MVKLRFVGAIGIVAVVGGISGALIAQAPDKAAFEVVSLKASKSGNAGGSLRTLSGGRIDGPNVSLRALILFAYQRPPYQLAGGPSWMATDRYDLVAKLPADLKPTPVASGSDTLRLAMQTLLGERFKLQVHEEPREFDIFALVTARSNGTLGPALKRSVQDCSPAALQARVAPVQGECGLSGNGPGRIKFGGMPLSLFAMYLINQVGRPVVDRTGLAGNWDFEFTFTPSRPVAAADGAGSPSSDADSASIFTALQEQLGLKLESTKGPLDVLVVDHVEHPTPD
jgi:uncharacterized protein (TIGR03435 family)